ncbi:MAG TPA: hypothetical protein DCS93_15410 [Microscillaceae bacterium]|nr:hypothetical protein [Microscillaceae bacterium]
MKKIYSLIITTLLSVSAYAQIDTNKVFLPMDRLKASDIVAGRASTNVKVVSASRSSKRVKDLPVTIHVITQEEIRRNGYVTLVDVMKSVPGVRVSQPGSGLDGETFLFRGQIGNYYTKILINNIPIQPSVSGGIAIGGQLPIAQAKQIEVIYGPASAVYGADAMTGVINIITDSPNSRSFANANVTLGEYGYQHFDFMAGGKLGRNKNVVKYTLYGNRGKRDDLNIRHDKKEDVIGSFDERVSYEANVYSPLSHFYASNVVTAGANRVRGYQALLTNNPNQILDSIQFYYPGYEGTLDQAVINALPQENSLFGGQIEYRGFTFSYNNMYRKNHSSLGRTTDIFSYTNPDNFIADRIQRYTLSYNQSWKKFSITTNASYLRYRTDVSSSYGVNYASLTDGRAYTYEASDDFFLEVLGTYSINKHMELTAGFSGTISSNLPPINDAENPFNPSDYTPFSTIKRPPHQLFGNFGDNPIIQGISGYFMQLFYQKKNLSLILGIREDSSTEFDTRGQQQSRIGAFYPRVAMLYKFNERVSVRGSYGRAFKSPSPRLTYGSLALPVFDNTGGSRVLNPNFIQYERVPNELLQPEFSISYEAGMRYNISKNIDLDLMAYYNQINQIINQSLIRLSTTEFAANGVSQFTLPNGDFLTRSPQNDAESRSTLYGLQATLRISNLIPSLKLNTDIYLNYAEGEEVLPNENDDRIAFHRMVPKLMAQINFSLEPYKNVYLRFENVMMTGWVRRFLPFVRGTQFLTDGYYNLDFIGRYQFNENLGIFLKIRNVFNAQYAGIDADGLDSDLVYNPQLMRNIQFGASFQLD